MISIKFDNNPEELQKNLAKVRKKVLQELGIKWWSELFPKRFHESNQFSYGISKRTASHDKKKKKKGWETDPLVFTGTLKEKAMGKKPSVKVDEEGLKVIFRGLPKYIYYSTVNEEDKSELQVAIDTQFEGNIFIAQRELKKKGEDYSLKHLSQVKNNTLRRNHTNLPPMTKELIAVSAKDEHILKQFIEKRYPEILEEIKKPKQVKQK